MLRHPFEREVIALVAVGRAEVPQITAVQREAQHVPALPDEGAQCGIAQGHRFVPNGGQVGETQVAAGGLHPERKRPGGDQQGNQGKGNQCRFSHHQFKSFGVQR